MDKAVALEILESAEKELQENGRSSISTYKAVESALQGTVERPHNFFFMEGADKMMFNAGRWKRCFLEG